jgi:molecular chaperone GrpE
MTDQDNTEQSQFDESLDASLDAQGERSQVDELEQKVHDLTSQLLRAHADYQNAVRRGQLNVVEARQQQIRDMAMPLVSVIDHFDRAVEVDVQAVTTQSVLEGVQIVRDELLRELGRFGLSRIDASPGVEFDPHQHEALMQQPHEKIPSQHVVQELQSGYRLGDRTLRPAKVIVAQ